MTLVFSLLCLKSFLNKLALGPWKTCSPKNSVEPQITPKQSSRLLLQPGPWFSQMGDGRIESTLPQTFLGDNEISVSTLDYIHVTCNYIVINPISSWRNATVHITNSSHWLSDRDGTWKWFDSHQRNLQATMDSGYNTVSCGGNFRKLIVLAPNPHMAGSI